MISYLCRSMRYFLDISYNGTNFHGWQHQDNANSVQDEIENALQTIFRTKTPIMGAGRTDAGVHARQMYAHFDVEGPLDHKLVQHKLNGILPENVAVNNVLSVIEDAHARFHATERAYEYLITTVKDPFLKDQAYQFTRDLDVDTMNACAQKLIGKMDFSSFCKSNTDVHTYDCDVRSAHWEADGHLLRFTIKADRFLRNMVRAITGTLIECGQGKMNLAGFEDVINARDRSAAGYSVPACGLYLTEITYPKDIFVTHE